MEGPSVKLRMLNPHLMCLLCQGYFVNATTITECMHTFCRSCLLQHLQKETVCPSCNITVEDKDIKEDLQLQTIVYKLVPDLHKDEMERRKKFQSSDNEITGLHLHGEYSDQLIQILDESEQFSISLEYDKRTKRRKRWLHRVFAGEMKMRLRYFDHSKVRNYMKDKRFLRCPGMFRVNGIKKFLRSKFSLPPHYQIEINVLHENEILSEELKIVDIAYMYNFGKTDVLPLVFRLYKAHTKETTMIDDPLKQNLEEENRSTAAETNESKAGTFTWQGAQDDVSQAVQKSARSGIKDSLQLVGSRGFDTKSLHLVETKTKYSLEPILQGTKTLSEIFDSIISHTYKNIFEKDGESCVVEGSREESKDPQALDHDCNNRIEESTQSEMYTPSQQNEVSLPSVLTKSKGITDTKNGDTNSGLHVLNMTRDELGKAGKSDSKIFIDVVDDMTKEISNGDFPRLTTAQMHVQMLPATNCKDRIYTESLEIRKEKENTYVEDSVKKKDEVLNLEKVETNFDGDDSNNSISNEVEGDSETSEIKYKQSFSCAFQAVGESKMSGNVSVKLEAVEVSKRHPEMIEGGKTTFPDGNATFDELGELTFDTTIPSGKITYEKRFSESKIDSLRKMNHSDDSMNLSETNATKQSKPQGQSKNAKEDCNKSLNRHRHADQNTNNRYSELSCTVFQEIAAVEKIDSLEDVTTKFKGAEIATCNVEEEAAPEETIIIDESQIMSHGRLDTDEVESLKCTEEISKEKERVDSASSMIQNSTGMCKNMLECEDKKHVDAIRKTNTSAETTDENREPTELSENKRNDKDSLHSCSTSANLEIAFENKMTASDSKPRRTSNDWSASRSLIALSKSFLEDSRRVPNAKGLVEINEEKVKSLRAFLGTKRSRDLLEEEGQRFLRSVSTDLDADHSTDHTTSKEIPRDVKKPNTTVESPEKKDFYNDQGLKEDHYPSCISQEQDKRNQSSKQTNNQKNWQDPILLSDCHRLNHENFDLIHNRDLNMRTVDQGIHLHSREEYSRGHYRPPRNQEVQTDSTRIIIPDGPAKHASHEEITHWKRKKNLNQTSNYLYPHSQRINFARSDEGDGFLDYQWSTTPAESSRKTQEGHLKRTHIFTQGLQYAKKPRHEISFGSHLNRRSPLNLRHDFADDEQWRRLQMPEYSFSPRNKVTDALTSHVSTDLGSSMTQLQEQSQVAGSYPFWKTQHDSQTGQTLLTMERQLGRWRDQTYENRCKEYLDELANRFDRPDYLSPQDHARLSSYNVRNRNLLLTPEVFPSNDSNTNRFVNSRILPDSRYTQMMMPFEDLQERTQNGWTNSNTSYASTLPDSIELSSTRWRPPSSSFVASPASPRLWNESYESSNTNHLQRSQKEIASISSRTEFLRMQMRREEEKLGRSQTGVFPLSLMRQFIHTVRKHSDEPSLVRQILTNE